MKKQFRIVEYKIGKQSSFFTIQFVDESENYYNLFVDKFYSNYSKIIDDVDDRIERMATRTGIRDGFFKDEGPNSVFKFQETDELRIYCLKYGSISIILGGGDTKENNVRTYQDKEELFFEVKLLRAIDQCLLENDIDFTHLEEYTDKIFEMEI